MSTFLSPTLLSTATESTKNQKKALTIAEYQLWRSISGAQISPDGEWVSWTYSRVRGDDTLHVVRPGTDSEHVVPFASGADFSDDGNWVAYFGWLSV